MGEAGEEVGEIREVVGEVREGVREGVGEVRGLSEGEMRVNSGKDLEVFVGSTSEFETEVGLPGSRDPRQDWTVLVTVMVLVFVLVTYDTDL